MKLFDGAMLATDMKFTGSGYFGCYSCGLTMTESDTIASFEIESDGEDKTVYASDDNMKLILHKECTDDYIRVRTVFNNNSSDDVTLEMISSFVLKGVKCDKIHRMLSFWSAEGKLKTETLTDLHLEPSWCNHGARVEKFGNVGSLPVRKYFPWIILENSEKGEFTGIQLYCPSSWQIELIVCRDESLTINAGLADRDFGHWSKKIRGGDSFVTPEAVIAVGDSIMDVSDKLVKAQHPDYSPVDNKMGIAFNEYCTTWGNPSFDNVKKICDYIAGRGFQYLTIDSGWYAQAENWWDRIGEWDVNQTRFPGGMKPVCDYIRDKGMIPGLWFEMEGVSSQCEYYNATEHLLKRDGVPLTVGGKRFFDMEDPWVIDYLSEKVIGLLKDSGFGYLKVDYNETLGIGVDDEDSFGEGLRKKVIATQNFFRKIKKEIPDIVIENCASGGHRLEPSMMELVSQASFSDAHETVSIPIIAANLHRVIGPRQNQIWAVMRSEDSDDRIRYSIINTYLGRMCLSGDIYELSSHQWDVISEGMNFYNLVSEIIEKGKTIEISSDPVSYLKPQNEQIVRRTYGDKTLAIIHRFENSSMPDKSFLKNKQILAAYGSADKDFTAEAILYK